MNCGAAAGGEVSCSASAVPATAPSGGCAGAEGRPASSPLPLPSACLDPAAPAHQPLELGHAPHCIRQQHVALADHQHLQGVCMECSREQQMAGGASAAPGGGSTRAGRGWHSSAARVARPRRRRPEAAAHARTRMAQPLRRRACRERSGRMAASIASTSAASGRSSPGWGGPGGRRGRGPEDAEDSWPPPPPLGHAGWHAEAGAAAGCSATSQPAAPAPAPLAAE